MAIGLATIVLLGFSLDAAADKNRTVRNDTRTSVNKNTNVNRNTNVNVNSNKNTNVNVNSNRHVDVDVDVDRGFHPVATVATVAVTAVVIGSMTPSLPPSGCVPVQIGAVTVPAMRPQLVPAAVRRHERFSTSSWRRRDEVD